jgi:Fe-S cluster assembly protein SufD
MPTLSPTSLTERSKASGEPAWLLDARTEALGSYAAVEPPKWRRTDVSRLDVEALAARAAAAAPPRRALVKARGVLHVPLAEAAREHPDLVRGVLTAPVATDDKWARLHHALWSCGSLLFVERGVEVAEPLTLESPHAPEGAIARDVLILDRASKAHVVARTTGAGASSLSMESLDVEVREGASLSLASIQSLAPGGTIFANRRARVRRDASLAWTDGQFGAGTTVVQSEARLAGAGASLRFIGAFFGGAGQHMDITTSALHEAEHTSSRLDMKGALTDDGYSANYSVVNIGPAAKNSSGHQHQETLLLSERARADAIPKLDVENNDVSASHGATVGQVDPDQVFYLQTRGLGERAAKRLVVEGFFEPLLREIPVDDVREEVRAAILARLG